MHEFVLSERVVSDDTLLLPEAGRIFKGGYVAIIKKHEFATPWTDSEKIIRFRKATVLYDYLDKHYPDWDVCFDGTALENWGMEDSL